MLDRDAAPRKRPSPSLSGIKCRISRYSCFPTVSDEVLLQYYFVLHSTSEYYNVLLQYCSVLQSATPVLFRTTKYYSNISPYDKVLLQYYNVLSHYYSVLQCNTPVLFRTTKYYSSTTTPVLLRTTKYYSSTSPYYKVLLQY